ncbi:MAG: nucleoside hydrolase [Chloroflexota bacterium]|jgi:purine nucleosidase
MTTTDRTPLLIDCDTGIDDALALLYACASTDAEIVGVGCVAGNVELPHVVRNTLAVLELAGRTDVEVAAGRDTPIARPLRTAADTHGPTGLGYADLPSPSTRPGPRDAAQLIVARAHERPGELTLVTLGPLSNVAEALEREPSLPSLLRRLVMMVGAYRVPGNTAPTMEWNAGVDPEALSATIDGWAAAGGPRPLAFGLDVTERAKLTPDHLRRLADAAGSADDPVVRFLEDALRFYFEFHSRYDGFYGAFIHDALVVAAALEPGLARSKALAVEVELEGRWTTGETVTDWRQHWGREPNLEVAVEADSVAFFERFIERVGRLARDRRSAG